MGSTFASARVARKVFYHPSTLATVILTTISTESRRGTPCLHPLYCTKAAVFSQCYKRLPALCLATSRLTSRIGVCR
ncbi:hypothetical protein BD311DRAFT_758714 [Dichomitus squalens]|uniref:Uncharacterized protein n=1 Tax=Dichomitus squalens TaxID=114155 RepID=A0A4V2K0C1_9APHY|nr:hypothetical protein BD311DRAFT_758714 [Dichomitus squalens]